MNNLEKMRGKHEITQSELAKHLGITKAAVNYMERKKISKKHIHKIAEFLQENPFEILGKDSFVILPKTEEDKKILTDIIKGL